MTDSELSLSAAPRERSTSRGKSAGRIVLEFLGSMNLAITLLVAVAIASVIGTVLQQNEPYADYVLKFGPFWFEVFASLGLYDVYSAGWFLAIMAFLVVSTSVCVWRHLPMVWREVTRYRDHVRERSLTALRHHRRWQLAASVEDTALVARGLLEGHGYRVRTRQRGETTVIAAMKGRANRLGYLFTHIAVVVIAVGALADGNLPLKLRELTGDLRVETRNIPVSQVPAESRLPVGSGSIRGSVTIPEGAGAGVVFLQLRDGYVVQDLPFDILVEDFRIRHYPNGQPKSFESDLVVRDPDLDEPVRKTISVNDPLTHDGYTIYQASFSDGGSALEMRAWALDGSGAHSTLEGRVFDELRLETGGVQRTLELDDFNLFNVTGDPRADPRAVRQAGSEEGFRNVGPSFTYRLRRPSGEAREYHTYMAPVEVDGRWYYLSGVRDSAAETFRYLHLPADADMSLETFMAFHTRLHDEQAVAAASRRAAEQLLSGMGLADGDLAGRVAVTAQDMISELLAGGFGVVRERLEARVAGAERAEMLLEFSRAVLQRTLFEVYRDVLAAGSDRPLDEVQTDAGQRAFFEDAVDGVSALAEYGAPVFLELEDFEHRQATGLQITRAPGKNVVYAGCGLLVAGIFLLFYVSHRRVWALVTPRGAGTELLLAGVSQRRPEGFEGEFESLEAGVDRHLPPRDEE
ncbi:cytochrome c biogenesis protein ResB [Sediminicurvatus halobius]|uniref:Cytochrome c biogenesis protein ResB n=1 Tax=Sediminicurvatus halobius TaxID=2182432 RepID=A0A2U2N9K2_9GAMM|nr:cytochrome c biogenesis protein ResB [Spiribacter halobius]PWG65763.1 cytochrome c biogenesis protein ResB [Spiribacter halobius]UEX77801.1 cytochrome c biogenesis protein ResB [Spiribacter halobius]